VHYLSDVDAGYRYLEDRQRAIYTAFPGVADPFSRTELNKPAATRNLSDLMDQLSKQGCDLEGKNCVGDATLYRLILQRVRCQALPTRFESPIFVELINLYTHDLEVIRQRSYPNAKRARFGSLPTGTIDAQAMLPQGVDDPIVTLNRDLFFFTGAFSKSIADAIPIGEENGMVSIAYSAEAVAQRLKDNAYIVRNFADAMSRMVSSGTSRGAEEVTLDGDHNRLHARLVTAMDQFIISHEQAHVLLGHVDANPVSFSFEGFALAASEGAVPSPTNTAILIQIRTHAQEFEADAVGYELMVKAMEEGQSGDPVALMVGAAAPHMVFKIIDAADTYSREMRGRSFSDGNHPAAADRVAALDPVYSRLSLPRAPLNGLPDLRHAFDTSLETLLSAADSSIRQSLGLVSPTR